MEKTRLNLLHKAFIIFSILLLLFLSLSFVYLFFYSKLEGLKRNADQVPLDDRNYHIIVTGTYENKNFLEEIYKGALPYADEFNTVVEPYVPQSEAEAVPIQDLFDYCSFANADGVISYIDNTEETAVLKPRYDETKIPLVATGQYSANLQQISFIGYNYWEIGKKLASQITYYLQNSGEAYIITEPVSSNTNANNLLNNMQNSLADYPDISFIVLNNISPDFEITDRHKVFITLTEEDTIKYAQILAEILPASSYDLIGFGSNETCKLYLQKGSIKELISMDPVKIGKTAIKEIFEFRNNGYANSYISADIKITRSPKCF